MAGGVIGFTPNPGWGKLRALLHPSKFKAALTKNIATATKFNAMQVQREIRSRLRDVTTQPNAQLTILIKSSSKPLVDRGDLFTAITHQVQDQYTAFVGVLKASGRGKEAANLIATLHEGATLPVTPAMRGLFFYLWKLTTGTLSRDKVSEGRLTEIYDRIAGSNKIIYPLKESTSVIHIPSRPFIKQVFDDKAVADFCKASWAQAVDSALKG